MRLLTHCRPHRVHAAGNSLVAARQRTVEHWHPPQKSAGCPGRPARSGPLS